MAVDYLAQFQDLDYKKNGRKAPEVDCWGFIQIFYKRILDQTVRDFSSCTLHEYARDYQRVKPGLIEQTGLPELGSLVGFFRTRCFYHVGVMINSTELLHFERSGLVLTSLDHIKLTTQQVKIYERLRSL